MTTVNMLESQYGAVTTHLLHQGELLESHSSQPYCSREQECERTLVKQQEQVGQWHAQGNNQLANQQLGQGAAAATAYSGVPRYQEFPHRINSSATVMHDNKQQQQVGSDGATTTCFQTEESWPHPIQAQVMTAASANQQHVMNQKNAATSDVHKNELVMTATHLASGENQTVDSNAINDSCREGLQPCETSAVTTTYTNGKREVCKAAGGEQLKQALQLEIAAVGKGSSHATLSTAGATSRRRNSPALLETNVVSPQPMQALMEQAKPAHATAQVASEARQHVLLETYGINSVGYQSARPQSNHRLGEGVNTNADYLAQTYRHADSKHGLRHQLDSRIGFLESASMDPSAGMTATISPARTELLSEPMYYDPMRAQYYAPNKVPAAAFASNEDQHLFLTQTNTPSYCPTAPTNGFGCQAMLGGNGALGDETSSFAPQLESQVENAHMMMDGQGDHMSEGDIHKPFPADKSEQPTQARDQPWNAAIENAERFDVPDPSTMLESGQLASQNSPPVNSLDDTKRDICLLPDEYYKYWPSVKEASEVLHADQQPKRQDQQAALPVEEFSLYLDEMAEFVQLVISICMLKFQQASIAGPTADQLERANHLYDSFFPSIGTQDQFMTDDGGLDFDPQDAKSSGFAPRIIEFVELMRTQDENYASLEYQAREQNKLQGVEQLYSLQFEQWQQMTFSALVILTRVLKHVRIQDLVGDKPQERYLLAVACIAAANQCDRNINGRPLFMKSLKRAAFIASEYYEAKVVLEPLNYIERQKDYVGLMTWEDWQSDYFDQLIQIYHAVLQAVDLHLEVAYPIPYVAQAIPKDHPSREITLQTCGQLLLQGQYHWSEYIEASLFCHPRKVAYGLFFTVSSEPECADYFTPEEVHYIKQGILGVDEGQIQQALSAIDQQQQAEEAPMLNSCVAQTPEACQTESTVFTQQQQMGQ